MPIRELGKVSDRIPESNYGNSALNFLREEHNVNNTSGLGQMGEVGAHARHSKITDGLKSLRIEDEKDTAINTNRLQMNNKKTNDIIHWFNDLHPTDVLPDGLKRIDEINKAHKELINVSINTPFLKEYVKQSNEQLQTAMDMVKNQKRPLIKKIDRIKSDIKDTNNKITALRDTVKVFFQEKKKGLFDLLYDNYPDLQKLKNSDDQRDYLENLKLGSQENVKNRIDAVQKEIRSYQRFQSEDSRNIAMDNKSEMQDKYKVNTNEEFWSHCDGIMKKAFDFSHSYNEGTEHLRKLNQLISDLDRLYPSEKKNRNIEEIKKTIDETISNTSDDKKIKFHQRSLSSLKKAEGSFSLGIQSYKKALDHEKERHYYTIGRLDYELKMLEDAHFYTQLLAMPDMEKFDNVVVTKDLNPSFTEKVTPLKKKIDEKKSEKQKINSLISRINDLLRY